MADKIPDKEILNYEYPAEQIKEVDSLLQKLHKECKKIFVVIDDDPTGGQTVHDIMVYTSWTKEVIVEAFQKIDSMFYIMTNSRSMTEKETTKLHQEIMKSLNYAAEVTGREYEVISRGDSTLRGHYPLETDLICANTDKIIQKELIIPFFLEGNRFTINDVHYLLEEGNLIPVGESEFSKDKSFGFKHSNLKLWIEEKTKGKFPSAEVASVSLEMLRGLDFEGIEAILTDERNRKIIVNAVSYMDLKVFAICYYRTLFKGVTFIVRSAASWPKTIGCFTEIPYIQGKDIVDEMCSAGGLVIIGSHVRKTTEQLQILKENNDNLKYIEFNQHYAVCEEKLNQEVERVSNLANTYIKAGNTVAIYTRRERIDLNTGSEEELKITKRIADAVTSIAENIEVKPRFVIVKGGITSSDIAVKAFRTKAACIIGQVAPGIPVWKLGKESKYPGIAYVIFPGNVGTKNTLYEIVNSLQ